MTPSPAFAAAQPADMANHIALEKEHLASYEVPEVEVTDRLIPGSQGDIPVRIFVSEYRSRSPRPIFVWFHGGAFAFGDLEMGESQFVGYEIADRANAVVISVDYRLVTDDKRFPVCQVDGMDAVLWALENAESLGADPEQLFVGGASAGACLTGSVALQLRDKGIAAAGFIPVYPVAHQMPAPHLEPKLAKLGAEATLGDQFILQHNPWLLERIPNYTAGTDKRYCFPGDATDKTGQDPFLIINADNDALRSGGELWAKQLRNAGVEVTSFTEQHSEHGYLSFSPMRDYGADHTLKVMADFIRG